jgi:integrase/recombinase XerD
MSKARRHILSRTGTHPLRRNAPRGAAIGRRRADDQTVRECVQLFIRYLPTATSNRGRPYSQKTIAGYTEQISGFTAMVGDLSMRAVTRAVINAHLTEMRKAGRTPSTVQTRDKVIRLFYGWAVGRGLLAAHPLDGQPRTAAPDTPKHRLSELEVRRLLAACEPTWTGQRNATIIWVLWRTGLRANEVAALLIDDYDAKRGHLLVREGKGGKERIVGVPDDCAYAIEEWLTLARGRRPGALFPSERDGSGRLTRNAITLIVKRIGKAADIPRTHAHLLRHTFAVEFLRASEGDIYTLSRLLGHTTITMSAKYLRSLQDEEAADVHVQLYRRRGRG